jgi:hypothetical protein
MEPHGQLRASTRRQGIPCSSSGSGAPLLKPPRVLSRAVPLKQPLKAAKVSPDIDCGEPRRLPGCLHACGTSRARRACAGARARGTFTPHPSEMILETTASKQRPRARRGSLLAGLHSGRAGRPRHGNGALCHMSRLNGAKPRVDHCHVQVRFIGRLKNTRRGPPSLQAPADARYAVANACATAAAPPRGRGADVFDFGQRRSAGRRTLSRACAAPGHQ